MLKVRHVAVETGRHIRGGPGIQCVGAYHAHLKSMVEDRFRGVATKYLNNYIVWHSFAGHARESFEEKLTILSRSSPSTSAAHAAWRSPNGIPCRCSCKCNTSLGHSLKISPSPKSSVGRLCSV